MTNPQCSSAFRFWSRSWFRASCRSSRRSLILSSNRCCSRHRVNCSNSSRRHLGRTVTVGVPTPALQNEACPARDLALGVIGPALGAGLEWRSADGLLSLPAVAAGGCKHIHKSSDRNLLAAKCVAPRRMSTERTSLVFLFSGGAATRTVPGCLAGHLAKGPKSDKSSCHEQMGLVCIRSGGVDRDDAT